MVGWTIERADVPAALVPPDPAAPERRNHQLSFRGKHNKVKLLALLALLNAAGDAGLTIRELATAVDTSKQSMRTLLCKWKQWCYVSSTCSSSHTLYQLRGRGYEWLNTHFWHTPFRLWYKDMNATQREFYKHNLKQWQYLQNGKQHKN